MRTIQWLAAVAAVSLSLPVMATSTPVTSTYTFTTTAPYMSTGYIPYPGSAYNPTGNSGYGNSNIATDFGNVLSFKSSDSSNPYNSSVTISAFASTGATQAGDSTGVYSAIQTGIVTYYNGNGLAVTSQNNTITPGGSVSSGTVSKNGYGTNDEFFGCNANGTGCQDNSASDPNDPNSFKSTDEQHAVDNVGAYETLLLAFNSKVHLNSITIGYPNGSTPDSDATVLYYTGSGVPPSVLGESYAGLLGAGWAVDNGSLYNLGSNGGLGTFSNSVTAQYYLIGAYIPLTGETANGDTSPDYLKLKSISTTQVPEPGSLALFGIAGGALFIGRRRRNARAI